MELFHFFRLEVDNPLQKLEMSKKYLLLSVIFHPNGQILVHYAELVRLAVGSENFDGVCTSSLDTNPSLPPEPFVP